MASDHCLECDDGQKIEAALSHLLDALYTDGGHHKQFDIIQAIVKLKGQEWLDTYRKEQEEEDYFFEDGSPA